MYKKLEKYKGEIWEYCRLNDISDIDAFVFQCFKQGYDIKKYGFLGNSLNEGEKHLKTEVIGEKRIEKPTEIIKEVIVEKVVIKEVPVDKIVEVIKEVPVEKVVTKIEYISDKSGEDELLLKIEQLNDEVNAIRTTSPTEVVVEKVVIKEIPVDRIVEVIKEVVDEKTKEKMGLLQQTLQKLRQDNSEKDVEINKLNGIINELEDGLKRTGAVFLKGSNINDKM